MAFPLTGKVTKASIISEFTTSVINVANAAYAYNLSNNPFTNAGYAAFANPHLSNDIATSPVPGDLGVDPATVEADDVTYGIAAVLRNYSYNASRIRDVLYQFTGGPDLGQGITLMNDVYRQGSLLAAGTPVAPNTNISGAVAGSLDTFISSLASALVTARGNTVTLTACHSSCHGSCHGSRGRR